MRRVGMKMVGLAPALLLAACGGGAGEEGQQAGANTFVPPVTQAPDPVPGLAQTTPITAYVGHYPRDAVEGVSFFDRSDVANALVETVGDVELRRMITGRDATAVPIFRQGAMVAAHACEAHDCADRHWTVLFPADGNREKAAVCYHDAETMGETSRWMTLAGTSKRSGSCPQA